MLILLESETRFSMVEVKAQANKNGTLIPFLNGVLISKTLILHKHHPSLYCTHIIAENYNSDKSIENTPFSEFLGQFTGFRPVLLNLLRAFLNIVFTNNTNYQVDLYIYGPPHPCRTAPTPPLPYGTHPSPPRRGGGEGRGGKRVKVL